MLKSNDCSASQDILCLLSKRDEVTGEWRKLHSKELHNLYLSPDIIRQVKTRRMTWAGHVARMGEKRKLYMVLVGKPEGKNHLEDQGVGGKLGSELIFGKLAWGGGCRLDLTGSGQGPLAGCGECGDEPSGSCPTELVSLVSKSQGNSVSIESGYGLDDRAIQVRSPAEAKDFSFSLCVQNTLWGPPSLLSNGYRGPFPGGRAWPGVTLTTHLHLVPRSWMSRSYTSSPPSASMACSGTALLYVSKIFRPKQHEITGNTYNC
jgi:hypothetical protein